MICASRSTALAQGRRLVPCVERCGAGRPVAPTLPPEYAHAVAIGLPLDGPARVQMSPARRIPSHGTRLFATTYAIDFMPVDKSGRTSGSFTWRTMFATEPPELFVGFGRSLLAPAACVVVAVHDDEPDHKAVRSPLALASYALTQRSRIARGAAAIAGNHVVARLDDGGGYLLIAHCMRGSIEVAPGERVRIGQRMAAVGNSGNSTEPHVHLQLMDGPDGAVAGALPFMFANYRELPTGAVAWNSVACGVPAENSLVEPAGRVS